MSWRVANDSQAIALEYYEKWPLLPPEEKQKYELLSRQYATKASGEIVNSANADSERFFSLIHMRYIWIQHMGTLLKER